MSDPKEIGEGGFGVVIKPALPNVNDGGAVREYPDNVTKLFFDSVNRNKILTLAPLLDRIMGPNEGHRINTYRRKYKGRNIPASTRSKIGIREANDIFPIRMPDLGLSIHALKTYSLPFLRIPITTILGQIIKVLKQVQTLLASGYIHGDIRETNVMIHPVTGTLTIIDFDLLRPVAEFESNGFYNNPPEIAILYPDSAINYIKQFSNYFTFVEELFDYTSLTGRIQEAFREAQTAIARTGVVRVRAKAFATYDSFGLACTLLTMFHILYPGSIRASKAELKESLTRRITKNGVPYTDAELEAITSALYDMIHSVLLPLSDFGKDIRRPLDSVLPTAISIEREVSGRLNGTIVENRVGGHRSKQKRRTRRFHR